jgi:hypothetical protein
MKADDMDLNRAHSRAMSIPANALADHCVDVTENQGRVSLWQQVCKMELAWMLCMPIVAPGGEGSGLHKDFMDKFPVMKNKPTSLDGASRN